MNKPAATRSDIALDDPEIAVTLPAPKKALGAPKLLRKCACGVWLGAREMRAHMPHCPGAKETGDA